MKTRAAVLTHMGHDLPYKISRPLSIETLELASPAHGQVLVKIAAAGLCHSDLSVINGSRPRVMPMVMGHEASGTVVECGPGVKDLNVGDHVVFSYLPNCGHCLPCSAGRAVLCENGAEANAKGSLLGGDRKFSSQNVELHHHLGVSAFSEFTVAAQESLVKITPDLSLTKAALFGCAIVTGVGAVVNTAKVEAGKSVAVFGMGGVGLSAVMGAKAVGAYPIIAVDQLPQKLELAKQAGAHHCVNANDPDYLQQIRDLSRGGCDYAIEAVGHAKVLADAYACTCRSGTTVTVGLPDPKQELKIQAVSLVADEKTIKGSYMGSAVPQRDIPRFIAMYQHGILPIDLLQSKTIRLDDINEAFDDLHSGKEVRQIIEF